MECSFGDVLEPLFAFADKRDNDDNNADDQTSQENTHFLSKSASCKDIDMKGYLSRSLLVLDGIFERIHALFGIRNSIIDLNLDMIQHLALSRDENGHIHKQLLEFNHTSFDLDDICMSILNILKCSLCFCFLVRGHDLSSWRLRDAVGMNAPVWQIRRYRPKYP